MSDELRVAFSKKEKVESFLTQLDNLKQDGSLSQEQYHDLHGEYSALLEQANAAIKETQAHLRKEFHKRADELEAIRREHDLLQTRLRVGEIRANVFLEQTKPLKAKIGQLQKEVANLQKMVEAKSAVDVGGTTKVNIPELKIKKQIPKVKKKTEKAKKPEEKAPTPEAKKAPSNDVELVKELVSTKPAAAAVKDEPVVPAEKSVPPVQVIVEKKAPVEKKAKEPVPGKKPGKLNALLTGAVVLVILIVAFLIIGLVVPGVPSPFGDGGGGTAPVISAVTVSDVTGSSVTFKWNTDKQATSQVILRDPGGVEIASVQGTDPVTEHSVTVDGIKPGIKYLVIVKSAAGKNEATYQIEQAFVPGAQVDRTPPAVSEVTISEITDTGAVISWQTDEPARGQVMISVSGSTIPAVTEIREVFKTEHIVIVNGLRPAATYTFTLVSEDKSGNQTVFDYKQTFATPADYPVGVEAGKRAPDFTLATTGGQDLTLSSLRGKAVMVMFWQRTCPTCVRELPMLQSTYETLANDNLVVLAINVKENAEAVTSFAERWKLGFPVLLDTDRRVTDLYDVSTIPVKVFIDGQGIIKEIKVGAFGSREEIESKIKSLLDSSGFN